MKQIMVELVKLAEALDAKGLTVEADCVDKCLNKLAKLPPFLEECPKCKGAMKKGAKMCKKCADKGK